MYPTTCPTTLTASRASTEQATMAMTMTLGGNLGRAARCSSWSRRLDSGPKLRAEGLRTTCEQLALVVTVWQSGVPGPYGNWQYHLNTAGPRAQDPGPRAEATRRRDRYCLSVPGLGREGAMITQASGRDWPVLPNPTASVGLLGGWTLGHFFLPFLLACLCLYAASIRVK